MSTNIIIRDVRKSDHAKVLAVIADAFGQALEANVVNKLWQLDAMVVEAVAECNGSIVGYGGFSEITTVPPLNGLLLGFAPLAVATEYQRKGVGDLIGRHTLTECKKRGARMIAVLGEPSYYSRFGFEPASDHNIQWQGGPAGDAFRLILHDDIHADDPFADRVSAENPRIVHYHRAVESEF